MLFLVPMAIATPADSSSGECATEVESTAVQSSGKELYEAHCVSCHEADGTGEKGFFPPVVATPWVENPAALTEVLLRGVSGTIYVNGERYASYMSPYGQDLTDAELIQLISYVRTELNSYAPIDTWTEQTISDMRTELKTSETIRGQKGLEDILSRSPSQTKQP